MEKPIEIAIAGITGRMGHSIGQAVVEDSSLSLTAATISPRHDLTKPVGDLLHIPVPTFYPAYTLTETTQPFDVLIDFTQPAVTLENLSYCQANGKAMVIGTTGFSEQQIALIKHASKQIPIVMASNMSRGITLLLGLIKQLTAGIGEEADIEILEAHHRHKKDAPSGTALSLGHAIAEELHQPLDDIASYSRHGLSDSGRTEKIGFSVMRAGDIVGEHTAIFALPGERIEIKHVATNRNTFALGALAAAKWVVTRQNGLFNMQDVLLNKF